jgi:hypothetical protein
MSVRKLVTGLRKGLAFSPIIVTPSELKIRLDKGDPFFKEILQKGKKALCYIKNQPFPMTGLKKEMMTLVILLEHGGKSSVAAFLMQQRSIFLNVILFFSDELSREEVKETYF